MKNQSKEWIKKRRFNIKAIKWLDKHVKRKPGEFWHRKLYIKIARGIKYEHMFKKLIKMYQAIRCRDCPTIKSGKQCRFYRKCNTLLIKELKS